MPASSTVNSGAGSLLLGWQGAAEASCLYICGHMCYADMLPCCDESALKRLTCFKATLSGKDTALAGELAMLVLHRRTHAQLLGLFLGLVFLFPFFQACGWRIA